MNKSAINLLDELIELRVKEGVIAKQLKERGIDVVEVEEDFHEIQIYRGIEKFNIPCETFKFFGDGIDWVGFEHENAKVYQRDVKRV